MKRGDKRYRVDIIKKEVVDGKEVRTKIGEKDMYNINRFAGTGAFNMSWDARNKTPRPSSKRQLKLKEESEKLKEENKSLGTAEQ